MVFRFRVCFYLSVQWRGWADIFPYLAIMIMIIIIMMMIIIVICRDKILKYSLTKLLFKIIMRIVFSSFRRKEEMFYLMTHSTHFMYGYMASVI